MPINAMVSLEVLKAGFDWSDQELYAAFCFDVLVRCTLGYEELGEGYFELLTLYNFWERLSRHRQATGENLIEQAFKQITDEQLTALPTKTGKQRMDSNQIASNIRRMSRLCLLFEPIYFRIDEQKSKDDLIISPKLSVALKNYYHNEKQDLENLLGRRVPW